MSKHRLLILGYSIFAQNKIVPTVLNHPKIDLVGIASLSRTRKIAASIKPYGNYEEAIVNSNCDSVYISLRNSDHAEWIKKSLQYGKNVICDKPIFLNLNEAKDCIRTARRNLLIYEVIPYLLHKQHNIAKNLIGTKEVKKMSVNLGFPTLPKDNFRNEAKSGGGTIYDQGSYLISAGIYYFNTLPKKVLCLVNNTALPTTASILMDFGNGEILLAHTGFEFEYRNELSLWGKNFGLTMNRAFAIPPDFLASLKFKSDDKEEVIKVSKDNVFKSMFDEYLTILNSKEFLNQQNEILDRTRILETLVRSSQSGKLEEIN